MRKVMIADDEFIIRNGIREWLRRSGEEYLLVGEARNGQEAALIFRQTLPDIVLMDILMPGLTGLQSFEQMREISKNVQGIFISAYADPSYLRAAIRIEAVDYLFKPIEPSELGAALKRAAQRLTLLGVPEPGRAQPVSRDAAAQQIVGEIRGIIQMQYETPLTIQKIADTIHLSPAHACTLYKRLTGETILSYLTDIRLEAAVALLRTTKLPAYAIAQRVGYQDYRYFKQLFQKRMLKTPAEFRELKGDGSRASKRSKPRCGAP